MKTKFIRLLLSKEFFSKHKGLLSKELFPDFLGLYLDALIYSHERYKRTLTLEELTQVIYAKNPMLTEAQKDLVEQLRLRIDRETNIGEDVASDVLKAVWKEEMGRTISKAGLDLIEGKVNIQDIQRLVERTKDEYSPEEDVVTTTTDVDEVLAALDRRVAWRFNIPTLNDVCPGISAGELAIAFARVEAGKSAFWVSSTCAPGGFAWQGARVLVLCNEEPSIRTMLRCINASSGLNKDEVKADPAKAKIAFDNIRKNLMVVDDVTMTMDRLDGIVKSKKPDIVIIDQLDKVKISGSFMRTDQELGAVYSRAREIAKIHDCAVIGITQASADAEGKTQLHYSMMAESKTSKAAEADLIIGIGKVQEPIDDPVRFLTLSKNKISGYHGTINTVLNAKLSRFMA